MVWQAASTVCDPADLAEWALRGEALNKTLNPKPLNPKSTATTATYVKSGHSDSQAEIDIRPSSSVLRPASDGASLLLGRVRWVCFVCYHPRTSPTKPIAAQLPKAPHSCILPCHGLLRSCRHSYNRGLVQSSMFHGYRCSSQGSD